MSLKATLQLGAPIIIMLGALSRVPALRTHGGRMVFAALMLIGTMLFINIDGVYFWVDAQTGIANVANLAEHVIGVLACAMMLEAVSSALVPGHRQVARLALPAVVLVAMVAAFIVAWVPVESRDFSAVSMDLGHRRAVVVYWMLGLIYSGAVAVQLGHMAWRHGPQATRRPTRVGMRIVVGGTVVTVAWVTLRSVEVLLVRPAPIPEWFDLLSRVLLAGAAPTIALGLLLTPIVTSCSALARLVQRTLLVRRLRPLWADLVSLCPHVVLPAGPDRRDLDDRLYRMVIEIHDATLTLRTQYPDHPLGRLAAQIHDSAGAGRGPGLTTDTLMSEAHALIAHRRSWLRSRRTYPAPTEAQHA